MNNLNSLISKNHSETTSSPLVTPTIPSSVHKDVDIYPTTSTGIFPKYHAPIENVIKYINHKFQPFENILEVGPGGIPLAIATHFIDHIAPPEESDRFSKTTVLDISTDVLPFENDQFDFVYCRHVLEDIQNPDFAFKELTRVAKRGFIEIPSAVVENTRGVDGDFESDEFPKSSSGNGYKGYIRHRSILWVSGEGVLGIIPKLPLIEFVNFNVNPEILKKDYQWNTYYEWDKDIQQPKCNVLKHDIDYKIQTDYHIIMAQVCQATIDYNDQVIQAINKYVDEQINNPSSVLNCPPELASVIEETEEQNPVPVQQNIENVRQQMSSVMNLNFL
ncbi:MAG: methyltransferase domain-containing protein [Colwellia sp.]|nr:methyltransferase domain-containing protein [Colwellia sp.]